MIIDLTPEQRVIFFQMLDAFQNGKRIDQLPDLGDANPFDLKVEVLDTSGESYQAKMAALLPYLEEQCAYGIEWDTQVSSPLCTRIGNLALHRNLPIQNRMKGVLLDDNGKVSEYLSSNWLAHDRSGARGQVMIELPAHWRKFEINGTKQRAMISEYPLPGYHFVKQQYVSAYEASIQRSTGKLCSVVNMGADFRGGNNQANWDNTYRSLLGQPATVKSSPQFRTAARARGAGAQWNQLVYETYKAVFWLYYIEYANRNCQAAFNAQPDANGYKQGGLGLGVTTMVTAEWSSMNGQFPFVPCGVTDSLGNGSGEVAYDVNIDGNGTVRTVYVPRYRGIENPFGHIWKWTDGINIEVLTDADGGTSKVYVCADPAKFIDNGYTGYEMRGLEARAEGYAKEIVFGEFGDIIPAVAGGGSTTDWCDYHYTTIAASGLRGVLSAGHANNGEKTGFGCAYSCDAPSGATSDIGSRLCFIPE